MELPERLDADLLEGAMSRHHSGLSVVAAPRDVMPLESFSPDFIRRLIEVARSRFAVVLADLPPAWSQWSFEVLRQSDEVLLVTQITVPGVRQARRQLDTRSDARRGGTGCVRTCRIRWSPEHQKKKKTKQN